MRLSILMPAPIPEVIKSKVIEQWLLAQTRDSIASANNISTGAVSNIFKEYQDKLGRDLLQGLRELYGLLKREDLTPAQCTIGVRIMKIFADQGVDAEAAEHFVRDIYKECNRLGIKPSNIVAHIEDLTKFSKDMQLREIEEYVNKKVAWKNALEEEIKRLNRDVAELKVQKSEVETKRDMILEQSKKMEEEMKSYLVFKQEIESNGISITDEISKFASTVRSISEYGYDPRRVIEEFNDIQYHRDNLRAMKIIINEKQNELTKLDDWNSSLLRAISLHSNIINIYNDLANMGFDIEKLKMLHDTIRNIAESNQIGRWDAIDKFFKDIETQYDAKLGFESEKNGLIMQIQRLEEEQKKQSESLKEQPFIGFIIIELLRRGLTEDDILMCGKFLLKMSEDAYSVKDFALAMIDVIKTKATSRTRTASDDKTIEILDKMREGLTK